jgi:hypothetical protein
MKRVPSAFAKRGCAGLSAIPALALIACSSQSCKPNVKQVSTDVGGGVMKGEPPMCFQYRTEAAPTTFANNIYIHANNTCSYTVDCNVYDDISEQKRRILLAPYVANNYMVASNVAATKVDVQFECLWKP